MRADRERLLKVLALTGSTNDSEALAALRKAQMIMRRLKVTWGGLIPDPEVPPPPPPRPWTPDVSPKQYAQGVYYKMGTDGRYHLHTERDEEATTVPIPTMIEAVLNSPRATDHARNLARMMSQFINLYGRLTEKQYAHLSRLYTNYCI